MAVVTLFSCWNPSGNDPSGSRHLTTHSSFLQRTDVDNPVNFTPISLINFQSGISETRVFTMIPSGDMTGKSVQGMRLWAPTDFLSPTGMSIHHYVSGRWLQNRFMGFENDIMSTTLPTRQNLFNQSEVSGVLVGSGDQDCTQFIWWAIFASGLVATTYRPRIRVSYFTSE